MVSAGAARCGHEPLDHRPGRAVLGGLRGALDGGLGIGLFAIVSLAVTSGLWWFTAWFLLLGDVGRGCSSLPV